MQNQPPILVFAQSARFIAESATQAGYPVWVADCYCDVDTVNLAQRHRHLPPLSELTCADVINLLTSLASGDPCWLICGTGIEKFYPIIAELPSNITYLGTDPRTIEQLKQPEQFFALLSNLGLPYPETVFTAPDISSSNHWLVKHKAGFGGTHINYLSTQSTHANTYFQRYLDGLSGSACFLSNGKQSKLLSINQQYHAHTSFDLLAISTPLELSDAQQHQLETAIARLCSQLTLKGLNSLDFIVTETSIFILEVNPRISASAELVADVNLFNLHIHSCQGRPLIGLESNATTPAQLLSYVIAESVTQIPDHFDWPKECHDIPVSGTIIPQQAPICTLKLSGNDTDDCFRQRDNIAEQLKQKLSALS